MLMKICTALFASVPLLFGSLAGGTRIASATASFYMEQGCSSDGSVSLSFSWQDSDPAATQRWIDVSSYDNGWQPNTYVGAGPISPEAKNLIWPGYKSGEHFYVRFSEQRRDGTWESTRTYDFLVRQCNTTSATAPTAPLSSVPSNPIGSSSIPVYSGPPSSQVIAPTSSVLQPQNLRKYAPKAAATSGEPGLPAPSSRAVSNRKASDYLGSSNPPADFCSFATCIANFWNGQGSVVMCKDGTYSKSGGTSASCSGHSGNA